MNDVVVVSHLRDKSICLVKATGIMLPCLTLFGLNKQAYYEMQAK